MIVDAPLFALADLDVPSGSWTPDVVGLLAPLLAQVRDDMAVLEIDCGPSAALSLFIGRRRYHLRQVAVDRDPRSVATAREAARRNRAIIEFVASDMTAAVQGRFDVVFSALGLEPAATTGLDRVRRFLHDAPGVLVPGGRAIFGVDLARIPAHAVTAAIDASPMHVVALAPAPNAGFAVPSHRAFVLAVR